MVATVCFVGLPVCFGLTTCFDCHFWGVLICDLIGWWILFEGVGWVSSLQVLRFV